MYSVSELIFHYTPDYILKSSWWCGLTLKVWLLNEYFVSHWNLNTQMNIRSHLETLILEKMIFMDIWCFVCKYNVGPGEILLMQPRLWSSMKHSWNFIYLIWLCRTKYMLSCKVDFWINNRMKVLTMHSFTLSCC